MSETYIPICTFCRLAGHYRRFIKGFANIVHPLYDMLGKEENGPSGPTPRGAGGHEHSEKESPDSTCSCLPRFQQALPAQTDASKEGLGAMLLQKHRGGHYHPVTFRSCSLTLCEKNYHSSKLEFLAL